MIFTRPAQRFDAAAMAALLNPIIEKGDTTAMTQTVDAAYVRAWMDRAPARSAWTVAESEGDIVGFQLIAPWDRIPPEACDIGTYVAEGKAGMGIGSALFEATKTAARTLGYSWINAHIRADNHSGLPYYQSRGFRDWKYVEGVQLDNGQVVDKIWKRFDL